MSTCVLGICDGSGFVFDEATNSAAPCRCREQLISRRRARSLSAVIPRKYAEVSFDRNPIAQMPEAVVRPVRAFERHPAVLARDRRRGAQRPGAPDTSRPAFARDGVTGLLVEYEPVTAAAGAHPLLDVAGALRHSSGGPSPAGCSTGRSARAMLANFGKRDKKDSSTCTPAGPLRCLATAISAVPCFSVSGL